jgi:hypothetical protein
MAKAVMRLRSSLYSCSIIGGIVPITDSDTAEHLIQNCASDRVRLTDTEWYPLLAVSVDLTSLTKHRS